MARIVSYKSTFTELTDSLYMNNSKSYKKELLRIRAEELVNMGLRVHIVGPPMNGGTIITFEPCDSVEAMKQEAKLINDQCEELDIEKMFIIDA